MTETELPPDVLANRRAIARRAEQTCRLMREYARKLHHIADQIYAAAESAAGKGTWAKSSLLQQRANHLLRRRAMIASSVEELARVASGLFEGAALPLSLKHELRLRSREMENALTEAREASQLVLDQWNGRQLNPALLRDVPVTDLAVRHRQFDEIVPQPVG